MRNGEERARTSNDQGQRNGCAAAHTHRVCLCLVTVHFLKFGGFMKTFKKRKPIRRTTVLALILGAAALGLLLRVLGFQTFGYDLVSG